VASSSTFHRLATTLRQPPRWKARCSPKTPSPLAATRPMTCPAAHDPLAVLYPSRTRCTSGRCVPAGNRNSSSPGRTSCVPGIGEVAQAAIHNWPGQLLCHLVLPSLRPQQEADAPTSR
jgi:hypothetical protein